MGKKIDINIVSIFKFLLTIIAIWWLFSFFVFLFMSIKEENVTTKNKLPYSIVPGPSMAVRPSEEQPL